MAQLVLFASPALGTTESTLRSGHCLSSKLHSQHLSILLQETYFLLVVDSTGVPNWSAVDSQKVNSLVRESHSLEGTLVSENILVNKNLQHFPSYHNIHAVHSEILANIVQSHWVEQLSCLAIVLSPVHN